MTDRRYIGADADFPAEPIDNISQPRCVDGCCAWHQIELYENFPDNCNRPEMVTNGDFESVTYWEKG